MRMGATVLTRVMWRWGRSLALLHHTSAQAVAPAVVLWAGFICHRTSAREAGDQWVNRQQLAGGKFSSQKRVEQLLPKNYRNASNRQDDSFGVLNTAACHFMLCETYSQCLLMIKIIMRFKVGLFWQICAVLLKRDGVHAVVFMNPGRAMILRCF